MEDAKNRAWWRAERREIIHAGRTTVAAFGSLIIARFFRMPEAYWAAVTAMIVMQSTLGAAWKTSKQRLLGTAIGAAIGALLATLAARNSIVFAAGVFATGIICALLRVERNAFRYAGITVAIILLVVRTEPAWVIAIHRFVEISIGIAAGLVVAAAWPEAQPAAQKAA